MVSCYLLLIHTLLIINKTDLEIQKRDLCEIYIDYRETIGLQENITNRL